MKDTLHEKLEYMLKHDSLTGLLNRASFISLFEAQALSAQETGEPFTIALLDLDDFSKVNDTMGHAVGDHVLVVVAKIVRELAGSEAETARIGGDEFAILFRDTDREAAFLIMEKIRLAAENLEVEDDHGKKIPSGITLTGSLASFPVDGQSEGELLRKADMALYRAKELGRNNIRLAFEEKMIPKTTHFTATQLERLAKLAQQKSIPEAEILREALDDLLRKYGLTELENDGQRQR